jgi:hypothetical protein
MTTVITIEKKKSSKIRMALTALVLLALTCGACGLFGAITGTTKPGAAEPVVKAQAKPTAVSPTAAPTKAPTPVPAALPAPPGDLDQYGCDIREQLAVLDNLQTMLGVLVDVEAVSDDMSNATTGSQIAAKAKQYLPTIRAGQATLQAMNVPGCFEDELRPTQRELAGGLDDMEAALKLCQEWEFEKAIPYISSAADHMENAGDEVDLLNPGAP